MSPESDNVSLKEFFDKFLAVSHDLDTRLAVLENKVANYEDSRKLQAVEYARRLDELNHAHQQRMQRDAEFLAKDVYDTNHKQLEQLIYAKTDKNEALISQLNTALNERISTLDKTINDRVALLEKSQSRLFGIGLGIFSLTAIVLWVIDRFLR